MPRGKPSQWHADVGARLRERRRALGWSMSEVAKDLDVSWQMYARYENGTARLPADAAVTLGDLFGMDLLVLLGVRQK